MNKLNRRVEYGLMALQYMNHKKNNELTTAKEVAERSHAPFDVIARVLQKMAQKEWLHVEHGVNGGYHLKTDLSSLTIQDLMEALQGPTQIARCLQNETCESVSVCTIKNPVQKLNQRLNSFYQSLSLRDLLESGNELEVNKHNG